MFNRPTSLAFDRRGNLLMLDAVNEDDRTLRVVTQAGHVVTTDAQVPTVLASSLAVDADSKVILGSPLPQPLRALVPVLP